MENKKENPWRSIPAADYEAHMSDSSVLQLQALSSIMKEQYEDYRPEILLVFGVCTGNGLEHIDRRITKTVYGIDVNEEYLRLCGHRYNKSIGDLRLISMDCSRGYVENAYADLIIADLFLEYIGIDRFLSQIARISRDNTVISVVIQRSRGQSFVSETGIESLKALDGLHREVDADAFRREIEGHGFSIIKESVCSLPSSKEFQRIDFTRFPRPVYEPGEPRG